MSKSVIIIDSPLTAAGMASVCPMGGGPIERLQSVENYIVALQGGNQVADMEMLMGAVGASATLTVSSTGSANGEIGTLLNVQLKAVTSGADPDDGEFNISGTPATQAANMEATIVAVLGDKLDVARNGAVITVTSKMPGAPIVTGKQL